MTGAVTVLARVGYAATTAEAVVAQAQVSKGLLWHYFADVDDLMEQTALHAFTLLRGAVAEAADLNAPVPDILRRTVPAAAGLLATHRDERRALTEIVANLRRPDGTRRFDLADYEDTYAQQTALFARGQADGDVRSDLDPRLVAVAYQGAVDALLAYLDAHPEVDATAYAAGVAEFLVGGLRPPD